MGSIVTRWVATIPARRIISLVARRQHCLLADPAVETKVSHCILYCTASKGSGPVKLIKEGRSVARISGKVRPTEAEALQR